MFISKLIIFVAYHHLVLSASSFNIIGIFPFPSKSHSHVFLPLMEQLALKGHNVTVASYFPRSSKLHKYNDIDFNGLVPIYHNYPIPDLQDNGFIDHTKNILNLASLDCNNVLPSDKYRNLLNIASNADVIIIELFNSKCFLKSFYNLSVPIVGILSSTVYPWFNDLLDIPSNPSYVALNTLPFTNNMTFTQRLINTLFLICNIVIPKITYDKYANEYISKYIANNNTIIEYRKDVDLFLVNSHFSLFGATPLTPNIVEVGGISHFKRKPKKLPQELEEFVNGGGNGFIYFSLGTVVGGSSLPKIRRDAFLQAFSELPYRVLWKWDGKPLPDIPPNIRMGEWFPQFDLLNHDKIKLFITHCGLLGLYDALQKGVPVIGIPLFADQFYNCKNMEAKGAGYYLPFKETTKESVTKAITTVLNDTRYLENAKLVSEIFHDRVVSPMELAIYSVEYIAKHKGAPHLKLASSQLHWTQYLLLDVVLFLFIFIFFIIFVFKFLFRLLVSYFFVTSRKIKTN